ncbi:tetratricopeptide repeat protein [Microbulbifer litoralis]|uniref:tetratricopeptide repeat protein n=1 Tax=Microbulbifer litoralis TaxID=2933965 RepID=UPI002028CB46|nr:tetratricopeptide repeat protein [Microbulbifer sp. GX H0434]
MAALLPLALLAAENSHHQRLQELENIHSTKRSAEQQLELAQHYYRERKLEQAYQQIDLFLQQEPRSADGWLMMGDIWREWEQWQEALESYDRAAKQSPKRAEIHLRRGQALSELGDEKEADKAYAQYRALAGG